LLFAPVVVSENCVQVPVGAFTVTVWPELVTVLPVNAAPKTLELTMSAVAGVCNPLSVGQLKSSSVTDDPAPTFTAYVNGADQETKPPSRKWLKSEPPPESGG